MSFQEKYLLNTIFHKRYPIEEISKNCLNRHPFDLKKKIFFKLHKKKIFFASSYDLLPKDKKIQISKEALNFYESTGLVIPPNTIFKNIYLVPTGFKYSIKEKDFYLVDKLQVDDFNAIEKLNSIIKKKYKFENASLLMSGGADSSLLLTLLYKNNPRRVIESYIFKSGKINSDLLRARKICKLFNSDLIELDSTKSNKKEVKDFLIKQTKILNGPIYEPLLFTFNEIIKNIKNNNVIFDGQGADTILGGLGHHQLISIYKNKFVRLCSMLSLFNIFSYLLNKFIIKKRIIYRIHKLINSLKEKSMEECLISSLYSSDTKFKINSFSSLNLEILKLYSTKYDHISSVSLLFLSIISIRELQKYSLDMNFEYCLPFLEKEFIHYCLSLPPYCKCKGNQRKIQIIDFLNGHLPVYFSSSQQLPFVPNSSHVLGSKKLKFEDPLVMSKNIRLISIKALKVMLEKF